MNDKELMTVNTAVSLRIKELLAKQGITQYRLEINSDIPHSRMDFIVKDKIKTCTFKSVLQIAKGFGMTLNEFVDSPYFDYAKLDLE